MRKRPSSALKLRSAVALGTLVLGLALFGSSALAGRIAVFPFESIFDDGRVGAKAGTKFRMKIARQGEHEAISEIEVGEALPPDGERPSWDEAAYWATLGREKCFADLVLTGRVARFADGYKVFYRLIDCRQGGARIVLDEMDSCNNEREISNIAEALVKKLAGNKPPDASPPTKWKAVGPNLVANGDFETGDQTPDGWETIDNLTSFWKAQGAPGKCLVIDTDVLLGQWKDWRGRLDAGAGLDSAPERTPTTPPKYDTVGGTYGVPFRSDFIDVKKDQTYLISFDMKGKWIKGPVDVFAKVFVKGYIMEGGQRREKFRMYKACRTETAGRQWEHFSRSFQPTRRAKDVKWMRVQIYAYWPADVYHFDNITVQEAIEE